MKSKRKKINERKKEAGKKWKRNKPVSGQWPFYISPIVALGWGPFCYVIWKNKINDLEEKYFEKSREKGREKAGKSGVTVSWVPCIRPGFLAQRAKTWCIVGINLKKSSWKPSKPRKIRGEKKTLLKLSSPFLGKKITHLPPLILNLDFYIYYPCLHVVFKCEIWRLCHRVSPLLSLCSNFSSVSFFFRFSMILNYWPKGPA